MRDQLEGRGRGIYKLTIHLYLVIITDYPHITTAPPFAGKKGEDSEVN